MQPGWRPLTGDSSQIFFWLVWLNLSVNHDLGLNTDIDLFYFEDVVFPLFDGLFLENNCRLGIGGVLEITEPKYGK